jgi:hypothetical protein
MPFSQFENKDIMNVTTSLAFVVKNTEVFPVEHMYHQKAKSRLTKGSFFALIFGGALFSGIAASAPAAPTPSELCASNPNGENCVAHTETPIFEPSPPPTTRSGKYPSNINPKHFHPGYYMHTGKSRGVPQARSNFDIIANNPQIVGVKIVYTWRHLEPQRGRYDFSVMKADLATLRSMGKRLWIAINGNGKGGVPGTPTYMWKDPQFGCGTEYYSSYVHAVGGDSLNACWWNKNVQARFKALYTAIGKEFNNNEYFEGANLPETAISKSSAKNYPGYSDAAVVEGYKANALAVRQALSNKTVLHQINYGPFDLKDYTVWLARHNIGISTPDVHLSSKKKKIYTVYPLYLIKEVRGVVPTGPDVQWDNYVKHNPDIGRPNTVDELLSETVKRMDPSYIFFQRREPYFSRDVLPTLRKYGPLPAAQAFYNK